MKKSKLILVGLLSFAMFMTSCADEAKTDNGADKEASDDKVEEEAKEMTMSIDTENSVVKWEGKMLGLYSHSGILKFNDGQVMMKGDKITGGTFTVDMTSMSATDENYDEEKKPEMLIGHLSSDDFFAVESNPSAKFEITGSEGNTVMGNLTIRGTTQDAKVTDVTIVKGQDGTKLNGNLKFDRQKYNVSYSTGALDKVISDEIDLSIIIAGK